MSRTFRGDERRLRIRGVRRRPADVRRLARVIIELAQADVETQAKHAHETKNAQRRKSKRHLGDAA
jgi:hypothetical protein